MQRLTSNCFSRAARFQKFRLRQAILLATTISNRSTSSFAWIQEPISSSKAGQNKRALGNQLYFSTSDNSIRDSILKDSEKDDRIILEESLDWLERSVIGLNLCPFAEKPLIQKNLSMEVVHGSDQVEILARVLSECLRRQKRKGTSLTVCPDLFPQNFVAFLEVAQMTEGLLDDWNLDGDLQIAHFHPQFEFDGSGDGIDNYTNRSPYPILHILRESEVSVAVKSISGDASKVWERNVRLLETMEERIGRRATEQVARGELVDETIQKEVENILKELKKP